MSEVCLYADIAGEHGCALRATADSPPPTAVQMKELLAENERLRAALTLACRDAWSDPQSAMEHYLATASDWITDPKEKP